MDPAGDASFSTLNWPYFNTFYTQHPLHATLFSKYVKCRLLYTFRDEDLRDLGMVHDTVNHTYNFVDAVTGVHTNHIEGTWYALKHTATPIRHRSPNFVAGDICTFMWKRRHAGDLWNAFLAALARVIFETEDFNVVDEEIAVDPAAAAGDEAFEEEADDEAKED